MAFPFFQSPQGPHGKHIVCAYESPEHVCSEICEVFDDSSLKTISFSDLSVSCYGPGCMPRLFGFVMEKLKHNCHVSQIWFLPMVFDWRHAEVLIAVLLKNHTLLSVNCRHWADFEAKESVANLLDANRISTKIAPVLKAFLFFLALRLPFQVVVVFADFFWSFLKLDIFETAKMNRTPFPDFSSPEQRFLQK